MKTRTTLRLFLSAGAAWLTVSLAACGGLSIPAPDVPVESAPEPPVPESTLVLPVTISLDAVLRDLGLSMPGQGDIVSEQIRRFLRRQATRNRNRIVQNRYVRRQLSKAWEAVQGPISLENDLALLLNPETISISPVTEQGNDLRFVVGMTARPRLIAASEAWVTPQPLPEISISPAPPEAGFHIVLKSELPFDALGKELTRRLAGMVYTGHGQSASIERVKLSASGNSLVIALKIKGSVNGTVYLSGVPVYDAAARTVSVRGLDYTLETQHVLAKAADWLLHTGLKENLTKRTSWSIGDRIDAAKDGLSNALNRELSDQVSVSGTVDRLRLVWLGVTRTAIRAVLEAQGAAEMRIAD